MQTCSITHVSKNIPPLAATNGPQLPAKEARNFRTETSRIGNMKSPIKLLLVDDHPIVRKGIGSCLAKFPNLQIVGEAADGSEALRKAKELNPDIVLMDVDMPEMDGLAVTQELRKEMPHVKVLILSMHRQTESVLRILQSGALGYVLKDAEPD